MSPSFWLRAAALMGFLAVALGAFGAHGLRGQLKDLLEAESVSPPPKGTVAASRRLEVFHTGVQYHMFHALALLAVAWLVAQPYSNTTLGTIAGVSFLAGILLFSGSLYGLGFSGTGWLGAITPLGGIAFLVGWAALFLAAGALDRAREAGLTP